MQISAGPPNQGLDKIMLALLTCPSHPWGLTIPCVGKRNTQEVLPATGMRL